MSKETIVATIRLMLNDNKDTTNAFHGSLNRERVEALTAAVNLLEQPPHQG